jgi:hypothetical protein
MNLLQKIALFILWLHVAAALIIGLYLLARVYAQLFAFLLGLPQ